MRSILLFLMFLFLVEFESFAGVYTSTVGFAAECPKTGNASVVAPQCSSWCKSQYGSTYNGSMVVADLCSKFGVDSNYRYCCITNATLDIVNKCKCDDPNQITVYDKNSGKSYKKTDNSDGTYSYTCENLYCFCNLSYYGSRQLMTASTDGACKKCPCVDNTYATYGGAQLCGWTANNYITLTDNSKAPSYTITDCNVGPISSAIPETYRTYQDLSGIFVLSGPCSYIQ